MEFDVRPSGDDTTVALNGRLTFADHENFRSVVGEIGGGAGGYVIDVSGLEFIDSAGLGMLLLVNDTAAEKSVALRLRGARGQVKKMLDVARFGDIIPTEP